MRLLTCARAGLSNRPKMALLSQCRSKCRYAWLFKLNRCAQRNTDMEHAGRPQLSGLLHPIRLQELVRQWLLEDTSSFDYGGFVLGEVEETAYIFCKSPGVLAGVPFVDAIFKQLECEVEWFHEEGVHLEPICRLARVVGKARNLLLGERVALNCLARTSGIATTARELFVTAQAQKWHGEIAGTRKTTPGFRMAEKYALLVGGISTHRYDLSSMVMLKDNHVWITGSITRAVKDARSACGFSSKIEVECQSCSEAEEAAKAGADVVMLDNFQVQALHQSAAMLKKLFPNVIIEASGGITADNIKEYFGDHVDVISLGIATQGYKAVDFCMKVDKPDRQQELFTRKYSCNTLVTKLI